MSVAKVSSVYIDSRTGAAVHEKSTLLEELSGHTEESLASSAGCVLVGCGILGKLLDVLHGD